MRSSFLAECFDIQVKSCSCSVVDIDVSVLGWAILNLSLI